MNIHCSFRIMLMNFRLITFPDHSSIKTNKNKNSSKKISFNLPNNFFVYRLILFLICLFKNRPLIIELFIKHRCAISAYKNSVQCNNEYFHFNLTKLYMNDLYLYFIFLIVIILLQR